MARQLRLAYPRATYHVMNRGNRHEAIFTDDADRQRFLDCLGEACAKTQWEVHAFCLRACLETTRGAAARDFGDGQGGLGGAQRPAAGCDGRASAGRRQKIRRPKGFRGNRTPRSFQTGSSPIAGGMFTGPQSSSVHIRKWVPTHFNY